MKTYPKGTPAQALVLGVSFSVPFITRAVYGAIFSLAGKRT